MQQAAGHAKTTHNLQDIPADIAAAVRAAIRDK
jgi:predicted small metal-binding protein